MYMNMNDGGGYNYYDDGLSFDGEDAWGGKDNFGGIEFGEQGGGGGGEGYQDGGGGGQIGVNEDDIGCPDCGCFDFGD